MRWEDLETRLAKIYLQRTEKVVFVQGDNDVDFQYVADVIDVAHHAGVQRGRIADGRSSDYRRIGALYAESCRLGGNSKNSSPGS